MIEELHYTTGERRDPRKNLGKNDRMNKMKEQDQITLSILDRLSSQRDLVPEWDQGTVKELIVSIERDLQNLLNTRKVSNQLPEQYNELQQSLLDYGIPDLTTININSSKQKEAFGDALKKAIERYEPRLRRVEVEILDQNSIELILSFRITAVLQVEPEPVPVIFDSSLLSSSRLFDVKGSSPAA